MKPIDTNFSDSGDQNKCQMCLSLFTLESNCVFSPLTKKTEKIREMKFGIKINFFW
jgi:hypothetical protein